jgi:hypothetical protein
MRLLLFGALILLPLTAQAEYLGNRSANELDPNFLANPSGAGNPDDPDLVINELGPYGNPYSPSSATNFEAITPPLPDGQERNDRGRLNTHLHGPDSMNSRYSLGSPFAPDGTTNLYGRSWRIERR